MRLKQAIKSLTLIPSDGGAFEVIVNGEKIHSKLATGEFPQLSAFAGDDVRASFESLGELARDPDRFERGLQSVLDGIELRVQRGT